MALDDYIGEGDKNRSCVKGKLVSRAVKYALSKSGKAFGVNEEQFKQCLNDPCVRWGIANILVGHSCAKRWRTLSCSLELH